MCVRMRLRGTQCPADKGANLQVVCRPCPRLTSRRRDQQYREKSGRMRSKVLLYSACLTLLAVTASAQWSRPKLTNGVGIDQNLDKPVPLDAIFRDEAGQIVPLRTYFGEKPVLFDMVFYGCTSLCPKSVYEAVSALKRV